MPNLIALRVARELVWQITTEYSRLDGLHAAPYVRLALQHVAVVQALASLYVLVWADDVALEGGEGGRAMWVREGMGWGSAVRVSRGRHVDSALAFASKVRVMCISGRGGTWVELG